MKFIKGIPARDDIPGQGGEFPWGFNGEPLQGGRGILIRCSKQSDIGLLQAFLERRAEKFGQMISRRGGRYLAPGLRFRFIHHYDKNLINERGEGVRIEDAMADVEDDEICIIFVKATLRRGDRVPPSILILIDLTKEYSSYESYAQGFLARAGGYVPNRIVIVSDANMWHVKQARIAYDIKGYEVPPIKFKRAFYPDGIKSPKTQRRAQYTMPIQEFDLHMGGLDPANKGILATSIMDTLGPSLKPHKKLVTNRHGIKEWRFGLDQMGTKQVEKPSKNALLVRREKDGKIKADPYFAYNFVNGLMGGEKNFKLVEKVIQTVFVNENVALLRPGVDREGGTHLSSFYPAKTEGGVTPYINPVSILDDTKEARDARFGVDVENAFVKVGVGWVGRNHQGGADGSDRGDRRDGYRDKTGEADGHKPTTRGHLMRDPNSIRPEFLFSIEENPNGAYYCETFEVIDNPDWDEDQPRKFPRTIKKPLAPIRVNIRPAQIMLHLLSTVTEDNSEVIMDSERKRPLPIRSAWETRANDNENEQIAMEVERRGSFGRRSTNG